MTLLPIMPTAQSFSIMWFVAVMEDAMRVLAYGPQRTEFLPLRLLPIMPIAQSFAKMRFVAAGECTARVLFHGPQRSEFLPFALLSTMALAQSFRHGQFVATGKHARFWFAHGFIGYAGQTDVLALRNPNDRRHITVSLYWCLLGTLANTVASIRP